MSDATADTSAADTPKIGIAWGDDISEERKDELDAILAAWDAETDHSGRIGPFDRLEVREEEKKLLTLTGADVFYLAARALIGTTFQPVIYLPPITDLDAARKALRDYPKNLIERDSLKFSRLHLENTRLEGAHSENATLREPHLEGAFLPDAHLEGAYLRQACLERAYLASTFLEGSNLNSANL
jgi:hypothetical protein